MSNVIVGKFSDNKSPNSLDDVVLIIGKQKIVQFQDGTTYPIPDGMEVTGYTSQVSDMYVLLIELTDSESQFTCGSKGLASTSQSSFDEQYLETVDILNSNPPLVWSGTTASKEQLHSYTGLAHLVQTFK